MLCLPHPCLYISVLLTGWLRVFFNSLIQIVTRNTLLSTLQMTKNANF